MPPKFCMEEGLLFFLWMELKMGMLKLLKFNVGYIMQVLAKFKNLQTSKVLVTQNTLCKYSSVGILISVCDLKC